GGRARRSRPRRLPAVRVLLRPRHGARRRTRAGEAETHAHRDRGAGARRPRALRRPRLLARDRALRRPLGDDRGAARDRGAVRGGGPARGARHRGGAAPVKPPPFECVAVRTVEEAIAQLGDGGDDARVLAGGQSLEAIEPGEALTLGALDGEVVAARADGERTIEASAFFLGPFTTALRPGEL